MVAGPWRARLDISTEATTLEVLKRRLPAIREKVVQLSRRWPEIRPNPSYANQRLGHGDELFCLQESFQVDTPSETIICANICVYTNGIRESQPAFHHGEGIDLVFKVLNEELDVIEQIKEYYKAGSERGIGY